MQRSLSHIAFVLGLTPQQDVFCTSFLFLKEKNQHTKLYQNLKISFLKQERMYSPNCQFWLSTFCQCPSLQDKRQYLNQECVCCRKRKDEETTLYMATCNFVQTRTIDKYTLPEQRYAAEIKYSCWHLLQHFQMVRNTMFSPQPVRCFWLHVSSLTNH